MASPLLKGPITVDAYFRLGESGVLDEDDRVELIDGHVVEMTPIEPPHASCVNRLNELFAPLAGTVATLTVQNPLILAEYQVPQPDFVALRHRADAYRSRHPGPADVLLLIEVADTTVESDRHTKVPRYARAGISEAWLVDLPGDGIEIYRNPSAGGYTDVTRFSRGDTLTPLAFPGLRLSVDRILG
jgi:Uma2 family endonuclease